jgi:site-specific DNA-cytosine methylase
MTPMLTDATIEETKTINFMEQERKHQINLPPELQGKKFRIRKLTPRECFRLMDVDDADIDKIQASGISNSAQYKLAGNSIVVSCLYHIIDSLLFPTEGPQADKHGQLSLF